MTKDDIARMAREAGGLPDPMVFIAAYERFANLVAAAALEQPEPVAKLFGTLPVYDTTPAAQWDKPSASFNDWWDSDVMPPSNPFADGSAAYFAWAGWQAAQRKPLTEPRIHKLWRGLAQGEGIEEFARAIEAAHGIKERNT
jgi:hypothetical protein